MSCPCNIAGMLSTSGYEGIISASLNGSTSIELASDGTVILGQTTNTLSISAYPFRPGEDRFLGSTCAASASCENRWIQKYDCETNTTYFIPQGGGRASITGGPIRNVSLRCDPGIVSTSFNASAQSGPMSPFIQDQRKDGFNLYYSGTPIPIESASPKSYIIRLGNLSMTAYLQSFSLTISPPSPATVSYNFVVPGVIL